MSKREPGREAGREFIRVFEVLMVDSWVRSDDIG